MYVYRHLIPSPKLTNGKCALGYKIERKRDFCIAQRIISEYLLLGNTLILITGIDKHIIEREKGEKSSRRN